MDTRDLFLGLLLLVGAGWIAMATEPRSGTPLFLVAAAACGLAGVVYLLGGAVVGTTVAGRTLTPLRMRAVSQALLGASLAAIGVDGLLADGGVFSTAIAVIGGLVIAFAWLLWTRGTSGEGPRDPSADDGS
ncbi:hypothetical protein [Halorubrum sp. DTA98]|uniref:hypothetical protein n=1 Tax=Halorubrum sp. DTA98 TaxID=3402163 RepID=UPI003AACBE51